MRLLLANKLNSEIFVFDGAMGTMLYSLGCEAGESLEKWGVEHENVLRSVHKGYIDAGADIITTDTLGGTSIKLAKSGLESEAQYLNKRLAEIAVAEAQNAARQVYVAGDIGPTGELMAPLGLLSEDEAFNSFLEQSKALAEGGVDIILLETMMDPFEACIAIRAAKDGTDLPVIGCMSFNSVKDGYRTMMGTTPKQATQQMLEAGADLVGANCGDVAMAGMPGLVKEMKAAGAKGLAIIANAGVPEVVNGKTVFPQSPEEMAVGVPAVLKAGANLIGGCCGTTPDHIKIVADVVRSFKARTA